MRENFTDRKNLLERRKDQYIGAHIDSIMITELTLQIFCSNVVVIFTVLFFFLVQ